MTTFPTYLLDADLSPSMCTPMCAGGAQAYCHHDFFALGTPDPLWVSVLVQSGMTFVTVDSDMIHKNVIRITLMTEGARALFLFGDFGNMKLRTKLQWIERCWPIVEASYMRRQPGCFRVDSNGNLRPLQLHSIFQKVATMP